VDHPKYRCVTPCGLTTCTVCSLAGIKCKILGHTDDMLSCVTPKERAAKFVCEKNYMAAMHARLRAIINAGALTQRQLKEERLWAEKAVAVTAAGSESGSPLAAHVANYTLVNDAVLGRAAAPPRARDADAAPFAARDAGAAFRAARLAGALTADRVRHGDRTVPAAPIVPAGGSVNNFEEA